MKSHYETVTKQTHLKELLQDKERNAALTMKFDDKIIMDFTHTKIDAEGLKLLKLVAGELQVSEKIKKMFDGEKINTTEKRQVWHVKLRTQSEGEQVDKDVKAVQKSIETFSEAIRSGTKKGFTGKDIKTVVAIGIGGSYLGPEFIAEALKTDSEAAAAAEGRQLKFLANVDPIDVKRALEGVDFETTLFVIVSKTFTTAETMLNARTVKRAIVEYFTSQQADCDQAEALKAHLCAVSTNLKATSDFGIDDDNVFGFWDWVGGRFSASSAVGLLPLSLHYGHDIMQKFLQGMAEMDTYLTTDDLDSGVAFMGLIGWYNTYICGIEARAILPYCQALLRFPAHIQQLDMESNGKGVSLGGTRLAEGVEAGPIILGEPGTNGQHSFYQLMHQGRVIAAEFIGFSESQTPMDSEDEVVSNHDELMSNFFAQPDALALGKTLE